MADVNEIEEQIQKKLQELPPDVQEAILNAEFDQKIQTIGSSNRLHIDQMQKLSDLTMLGMLGFIPLEQFEQQVADKLSTDPTTAQKLSSEINKEIFSSIRESMKAFVAGQGAESQATTPEVNAPAPAIQPITPAVPKIEMHPADLMLTEKTITVAPSVSAPATAPSIPKTQQPAVPPKPTDYKADPYREPIA